MAKINYPTKNTGDKFFATEANEIKTSVNALYDEKVDLNPDGSISVNGVTATGPLNVTGDSIFNKSETSTTNIRPVVLSSTVSADPAAALAVPVDFHGVDSLVQTSSSNVNGNTRLYAIEGRTFYSGSGSLGALVPAFSFARHDGTGSINTILLNEQHIVHTGSGNTLIAIGTRFRRPTISAGSITNCYGLYIENVNVATGSNYSIYSEGGANYFGGGLEIAQGSGVRLDVSGISQFRGNVSASLGEARGVNNIQTLTATANNDHLIAYRISPAYTTAGFTGIRNMAIKVEGATSEINLAAQGGRVTWADGSISVGWVTGGKGLNLNSSDDISMSMNGTMGLKMFNATRSVILQNGGTITDDGINRLQVTGSVKATQYRVSAMETAPASASATGTTGEIRYTATHIYVCTATNTWVRSALATW